MENMDNSEEDAQIVNVPNRWELPQPFDDRSH